MGEGEEGLIILVWGIGPLSGLNRGFRDLEGGGVDKS